MTWKDTTSYSRGGPRIPLTWSLDLGDLHIAITKGHIYHPDKWVMHCEPWFCTRVIADGTHPAEKAQSLAIEAVRKKLEAARDALHSATA